MRTSTVFALSTALLAGSAVAQTVSSIGYVYPAGGRQGTSFEVTVGGQRLREPTAAIVSGSGVKASIRSYHPLLSQRELDALREELNRLLQRRRQGPRSGGAATTGGRPGGSSTADQDRIQEIQRIFADRNRRREIPAIAETTVVQVTILPDALPGARELRLVTAAGPTNPLVFEVGELPEYREQESEAVQGRRTRGGSRGARGRRPDRPATDENWIDLPATANGRILPGDADRFRFRASKGQRIVAAVAARELIPYLADAVPGWFQATLALFDETGREVAMVDDYQFHPDPVLCYQVPADGTYSVEIRDALYRGREDFVYRIAIGELPFVTSIFPLGGPVGSTTKVQLRGVNLPSGEITVAGPHVAGIAPVRVRCQGRSSNALPFVCDDLPEAPETEPNDTRSEAQKIAVPGIVNGHIDRAGDTDVFAFDGRYGQEVIAEVQARRLQSPVDSVLRLFDETGQQVASNDDHPDPAAGRETHHADSYIRIRLPRSGRYYLHLADVQDQGGPDHGYRLRVSLPRPDFDLRITPSCIVTRAGATVPFEVRALRRDEFAGPISLELRDAPKGFELHGATVPAGQDRVRVTLTVPAELAADAVEPVPLRIVGQARHGTIRITRDAVAADDVMQAFIYRHLVPAQELLVSVRGRSALPIHPSCNRTVVLPAGGIARVKLHQASRWAQRWIARSQVQLTLDAPPPGIAIQKVTQSDGGFEIALKVDSSKAQAGTAGNLIFAVHAAPRPEERKGTKRPARPAQRRALGVLPAVPYRIAKRNGVNP